MSVIKKIAGDTAIYGVSSVLFKIVNFLFMSTYLTRKFSNPEEFARHGLFYSFAALGLILFTLRMETAFFRFGADRQQRDKVFTTGLFIIGSSTLLCAFVFIGFDRPLAALISDSQDTRYLLWIVLIMIADALVALPFAKMRLDNKPAKFALFKALNTVLNIILALLFLEILPWMDAKGWFEASSFLDRPVMIDWVFIANVLASFILVLLLSSEYFKRRFEVDFTLMKKMLTYAWPLIIVGVAGVFNQFSDRVFLNNLSSAEDSGIYNGAIKIAIIMSLFVSAFNYAAEPFFFNQMKNKDAKLIYARVAQAFTVVGSLLFVVILFYIDIIEYLIGANYRDGLVILPYALLGFLLLGLHYNFSIWYKVKDRTTVGAWIGLAGMVVTIAGNVLLIPEIGLLGSSISLTICFGVMAFGSYITGRKNYPIPYDMKRILGYILWAIGLLIISQGLMNWLEPSLIGRLILNTFLLIAGSLGYWLVDKHNLKALIKF